MHVQRHSDNLTLKPLNSGQIGDWISPLERNSLVRNPFFCQLFDALIK